MIDLPLNNPDIRSGAEIRSVLADPSCVCEGPLYEMYRGVCRNSSDKEWLETQQIRYDVTRIPPRTICRDRITSYNVCYTKLLRPDMHGSPVVNWSKTDLVSDKGISPHSWIFCTGCRLVFPLPDIGLLGYFMNHVLGVNYNMTQDPVAAWITVIVMDVWP